MYEARSASKAGDFPMEITGGNFILQNYLWSTFFFGSFWLLFFHPTVDSLERVGNRNWILERSYRTLNSRSGIGSSVHRALHRFTSFVWPFPPLTSEHIFGDTIQPTRIVFANYWFPTPETVAVSVMMFLRLSLVSDIIFLLWIYFFYTLPNAANRDPASGSFVCELVVHLKSSAVSRWHHSLTPNCRHCFLKTKNRFLSDAWSGKYVSSAEIPKACCDPPQVSKHLGLSPQPLPVASARLLLSSSIKLLAILLENPMRNPGYFASQFPLHYTFARLLCCFLYFYFL